MSPPAGVEEEETGAGDLTDMAIKDQRGWSSREDGTVHKHRTLWYAAETREGQVTQDARR